MQQGTVPPESRPESTPPPTPQPPTTPPPGGAPPGPGPYAGAPPAPAKTSPFAIVALVVGIASCCLIFIPWVGIIFPVGAIIFGVLGMRQCDQDPHVTGKGLAIAGLVLGIVFALAWVVLLILGVAFLSLLEELDFEDMENIAQYALSRLS